MKIEELKKLVADSFKEVSSKEEIETIARINAKIEECAAEQKKLEDDNRDLLNSYKEVVLHTSVKPNPNINTGAPTGNEVDFDTMLSDFINNIDANKQDNK